MITFTMKPTYVSDRLSAAEGRVVLSCDQNDVTVKDVLDAAWFRGDLQVDWEQLLYARAREQRADELELDAEDETLQSMSEEFRYERDLLTAEETERWLAVHDVSEEDFTNYFLRHYWGKHLNREVELQKTDFAAATPEFRELLRVDLVLSGRFGRHVRDLSWRLAAKHGAVGQTPGEAERLEQARFFERTSYAETELTDALVGLSRDPQWFSDCVQMEAAYRCACDQLLTDEQRARLLAALRLPLIRIEVETMRVQSPDAANEAVLCLREDQSSMSELARECDSTCERRRVFLGDCSQDMQQALLSASPGEILALQREKEVFVVCRLLSKTEPNFRDDDVIDHLDSRLLQTHFAERTRERVRFAKGWEQMA